MIEILMALLGGGKAIGNFSASQISSLFTTELAPWILGGMHSAYSESQALKNQPRTIRGQPPAPPTNLNVNLMSSILSGENTQKDTINYKLNSL